MRKIINGKRYDTETATFICDCGTSGLSRTDFNYEDTALYRTANGRWFLAGEGGPRSRWYKQVGNGDTWGEGIQVVDADQAREIMERFGDVDDVEKYFPVEDA